MSKVDDLEIKHSEEKESKDEKHKEKETKEVEKKEKEKEELEKDSEEESDEESDEEKDKGKVKVKVNEKEKVVEKVFEKPKVQSKYEEDDSSYVNTIYEQFLSDNSLEIKIKLGIYNTGKDDSRYFSDEISKIAYYYFIDFFKNKDCKHDYNFYTIKKYDNDIITVDCGNNYQHISRRKDVSTREYDNCNVLLTLEKDAYSYDEIPTCNEKIEYSYRCVKNTFKFENYNVNIYHNIMEKSKSVKNSVPIYQINFNINHRKQHTIDLTKELLEESIMMYMNFRRNCQDYFIYFNNLIVDKLNISLNEDIIKNYDFNDNITHKISTENHLNSKTMDCFFDIETPKIMNIEDIPYISDYLFFPKPLGELYFLFIDSESNLFYINSTNVVHISDKVKNVSNTILIGYLSGDLKISINNNILTYKNDSTVFMIYDALILDNEDITSKSMIERHKLLEDFHKKLNIENVGLLKYKKPTLSYCDCQKENIICTCRNKNNNVSSVLEKIIKECNKIDENNGILMKHNNHYSNILKDNKGFRFPILKYDKFNDIRIKFAVFHSHHNPCSDDHSCYNLYSLGKNGLELFKGTEKFVLLNDTVSLDIDKFKLLNDGSIIEVSWDGEKFIPIRICSQELLPISSTSIENLWNGVLYNKLVDENFIEYSKYQIGKIEDYHNTENISENVNIKILLYYLLLTCKNTNTVNNINRVIKKSECKLAKSQILISIYQSENTQDNT